MQQATRHLVRGVLTAAIGALLMMCGPVTAAHAQGPAPTHRGTTQPSRSHAHGVAALQSQPSAGQQHRLQHAHPPVDAVAGQGLPERAAAPDEGDTALRAPGSAQHTSRSGRAPPA
jgi:hypothetical protein